MFCWNPKKRKLARNERASDEDDSSDRHNLWSGPDDLFVNELCHVLKQNRQWQCDGPKLRLLNRHWRMSVDKTIDAVQPHRNPTLQIEDARALLKFPSLKSLKAVPFYERKKGAERYSVLQIIPYLRSLEHLSITAKALNEIRHRVSEMTALTSLDIKTGTPREEWFRVMMQLPLRSLALDCHLRDLKQMTAMFPTLTYLDADVYDDDGYFPRDVGAMESLNYVKIFLRGEKSSVQHLSRVSALASLRTATALTEADLDVLRWMPSLRRLDSVVASNEAMRAESLKLLLKQLTSLRLEATNRFVETGALTEALAFSSCHFGLKDLWLARFSMNGMFWNDRMTEITSLSFDDCHLELNGLRVLRLFNRLSYLSLVNVHGNFFASGLHLDHDALPSLKTLKISLRVSDYWVSRIGRCERLCHASIRFMHPANIHSDVLGELRRLRFLKTLELKGLPPRCLNNLLEIIKGWDQLEHLDIPSMSPSQVERVRKGHPYLNVAIHHPV